MTTFTKQLPINTTILTLLILLFSSCSRQGRTVIEGHVYQFGTDTPIPNAKIEFTEFVAGRDFGNQGFTFFLDSIFTDDEGYYKFVHKGDTDGIFFKATKPNYFEVSSHYSNEFSIFSNGGRHTQDIEMDAHANLTFHLLDNNEIENSHISIAPGFSNSNSYSYNNSTVVTGKIRTNKYHEYAYLINDIIQIDSIMLSPFESDTITINF